MIRALRKRFDDPEGGLDKQPLLGSAAGIQVPPPPHSPHPIPAGTAIRTPSPPNLASSPPRNYTTTDPTQGAA